MFLLGTFDKQSGGTNSSYFWEHSYFGGPSPGSDLAPFYSFASKLNKIFLPAPASFMCQLDTNSVQGDILV